MKALLLALALLPLAPQAQASEQICGTVFIGSQCDMDFCLVGFTAVNPNTGKIARFGLSENGSRISRDYDISSRLEAMNGKQYCADSSAVDAIGSIDLDALTPAN